MDDPKKNLAEETSAGAKPNSGTAFEQAKPKSAGNRSFRKHNKKGFYRLLQRKKKKKK
jgi:hypothetical protein